MILASAAMIGVSLLSGGAGDRDDLNRANLRRWKQCGVSFW